MMVGNDGNPMCWRVSVTKKKGYVCIYIYIHLNIYIYTWLRLIFCGMNGSANVYIYIYISNKVDGYYGEWSIHTGMNHHAVSVVASASFFYAPPNSVLPLSKWQFPKNPWTLKWKGEWTCMTQGCFCLLKLATFEVSGFLGLKDYEVTFWALFVSKVYLFHFYVLISSPHMARSCSLRFRTVFFGPFQESRWNV